jgi:hypothetical protein
VKTVEQKEERVSTEEKNIVDEDDDAVIFQGKDGAVIPIREVQFQ